MINSYPLVDPKITKVTGIEKGTITTIDSIVEKLIFLKKIIKSTDVFFGCPLIQEYEVSEYIDQHKDLWLT